MKTLNVEIPVGDIVKAVVADGSVFKKLPLKKGGDITVFQVDDDVIVDIDRLLGELVFKITPWSYRVVGYRIDTSDKNNKPEFILERID